MIKIKNKKLAKRIKNSLKKKISSDNKRKKQIALIKRTKAMMKKNKRNKKVKWIRNLFLFFVIVGMVTAGGVFIWVSSLKIPDINTLHIRKVAQSTKIYDKNGVLLYRLYDNESRTVVPISQISKHIQHAAIAIEDKDFYIHHGIKPASILMAAWENFRHKRKYKRGGSTITQQVIKNTILTSEKTITRKAKEAILAYKLEQIWTKDQILELYLNEAPYGGILYGIEEASVYYFDKHASDLGIAESAYLAAMPQAPTTYSPYGKHRKALDERKNLVLQLMFEQGYINATQYKKALEEKVKFVFKTKRESIKAPHFVMYVIEKLKEQFGDDVRTSGLKVYTTLDYELQKKIEEIVKDEMKNVDPSLKVTNTGAVVIQPKTGHILAMVGSRDYFDDKIDGKFNIATALRQPGSTFKPIVYLTAFEKGYTPKTILWDVPTEFNKSCFVYPNDDGTPGTPLSGAEKRRKGCYSPQDFDGRWRGPLTIEQALPESRNIPAVKALYLVGIGEALKNARALGLTSLNKSVNYYGLSLVLGGGEVKLLNLTSAYGVFANEGVKYKPIAITKIEDSKEKEIFTQDNKPVRVFDAKYVRHLNKILADPVLKYPTYGRYSDIYYTNRDVAVKTGTTNDFKDFWDIGYDPGNVVVGTWLGNNDSSSASSFKSGAVARKIWRKIMDVALEKIAPESFPTPEPLTSSETKPVFRGIYQGDNVIKIDIKNNTIATDETPSEFIKEIVIPEYHSILHWVNKDDPRGPMLDGEHKDSMYLNWEQGVLWWAQKKKNLDLIKKDWIDIIDGLKDILTPAQLQLLSSEKNDGENNNINENIEKKTEYFRIKFKILSPGNNDVFRKNEKVFVKLKRKDDSVRIVKYYIYFNGKLLGKTNNNIFKFKIEDIENLLTDNQLKIKAEDVEGNTNFKVINLKVKL